MLSFPPLSPCFHGHISISLHLIYLWSSITHEMTCVDPLYLYLPNPQWKTYLFLNACPFFSTWYSPKLLMDFIYIHGNFLWLLNHISPFSIIHGILAPHTCLHMFSLQPFILLICMCYIITLSGFLASKYKTCAYRHNSPITHRYIHMGIIALRKFPWLTSLVPHSHVIYTIGVEWGCYNFILNCIFLILLF